MKQKRLVNLHWGDMTDSSSLIRIIGDIHPTEIYNLAAQSHVKVSFDVRNIRLKRMLWEHSACWRLCVSAVWKRLAGISGFYLGTVRKGAGSSAEGNDTVLSAFSVRSGQAVRILDYQELPRELRDVCRERYPVQPRVNGAERLS